MSRIKESCYDESTGDYNFDTPTPDDTIAGKTCYNCKHAKIWDDPGSYMQPPDSGWDCNHPNCNELLQENSPSDGEWDDEFKEPAV